MKRYASRKKGIRKIKNIVVIVCEGKKTEPLYFNGFKKRYSGVQIETCHEKCTDPKNITNFARKKIKEYGIDFSDGMVYGVYLMLIQLEMTLL